MKILNNGISTRREEDAVSALLLRSWNPSSREHTKRRMTHDVFSSRFFHYKGGGNGPHNGPELDGPFWVNFSRHIVLHSITSFANIVFGAIKRILSIAITVESAIRVESKDIQ